MRRAWLLVAVLAAGCGGGDEGDGSPCASATPAATVVNATEREEMAVSAACRELKAALRETRPLPESGAAKVSAMRREVELVREYRRALEAISPGVVPSWHVGGQIGRAQDIEKDHAVHIRAAGRGVSATRGGYPVNLWDPRSIVDDDEQKFGADCG